jgi:hypothetical protein
MNARWVVGSSSASRFQVVADEGQAASQQGNIFNFIKIGAHAAHEYCQLNSFRGQRTERESWERDDESSLSNLTEISDRPFHFLFFYAKCVR